MVFLGLPATDAGEVEVTPELVDLLQQVAEVFGLPGERGSVGGGIEGLPVPGLAEEVTGFGTCQVLGDSGGDSQEGLWASGGGGFEAETPDLRGRILVFDRDPELGHVVCEAAEGGVAFLAGSGESGSGDEDFFVERHELCDRAVEPWRQALERGGWGWDAEGQRV